jgi:hypothetical protein
MRTIWLPRPEKISLPVPPGILETAAGTTMVEQVEHQLIRPVVVEDLHQYAGI